MKFKLSPGEAKYFAELCVTIAENEGLRKIRNAAQRYMEVSYPCHCGELAPGPCCEECRAERELREALNEMEMEKK